MFGATLVSDQLYGQLAESPAAFSGSLLRQESQRKTRKTVGGHSLPLLVKAV